MPAPYLHVTFAEMLADAPIPRAVRDAVRQARPYARLGSLYHDFPYYVGVTKLCVGHWREKALDLTPWGVRLHRDSPGAFAEHLVRALRDAPGPLTRTQRRAFVAGFLSHAIIDHTMHPLVNHLSERRLADLGGEITHHHKMVEKYHSLFFHIDRFGEDVLGSPEMAARAIVTDSGRVDRTLASFMTGLLRGHFGDAPSAVQWARWVRCYQRIAFLLSLPPAARNSRRVRTDEARQAYYAAPSADFRDFFASAEARTHRVVTLAHDYAESGDFSDVARQRFVEALALDDLAYPDETRHPERRVALLTA